MKFNEYQKWTPSTAIFKEKIKDDKQRMLYPFLGVLEEAGEVAGKIKKLYRDADGIVTPEFASMLVLELGDVCWYVSTILNDSQLYGVVDEEAIYAIGIAISDEGDTLPELAISLCRAVDVFAFSQHHRSFNACHVLHAVSVMAFKLNSDLGSVLSKNVDKLSNRKERGTIGGSGDNR